MTRHGRTTRRSSWRWWIQAWRRRRTRRYSRPRGCRRDRHRRNLRNRWHRGRTRGCRRRRPLRHSSGPRCCRGPITRLRCYFRIGNRAEVLSHQVRMIVIQRARVSLLLGDSDLGKVLNQNLSLDLKLPRKFVDSNLSLICHLIRFSSSIKYFLPLLMARILLL